MKILIITDSSNNILGAVRTEPITFGQHTVQAVAHPAAGQIYREVEVADDFFFQTDRQLHDVEEQLRTMLSRGSEVQP